MKERCCSTDFTATRTRSSCPSATRAQHKSTNPRAQTQEAMDTMRLSLRSGSCAPAGTRTRACTRSRSAAAAAAADAAAEQLSEAAREQSLARRREGQRSDHVAVRSELVVPRRAARHGRSAAGLVELELGDRQHAIWASD